MHVHLDPVGGLAGDMFAAALLDAWPELEAGLQAALARAGLTRIAAVAREAHTDGVLTGSRFRVTPAGHEQGPEHEHEHGHGHGHHHGHEHGHALEHDDGHGQHHPHRPYREIRTLLGEADLPPAVRERALDIFLRLGEAESRVHGVAIDEVTFHEVGSWDSIADVVSAAWLIEAIGAPTWSCAPVPLGRGRVHTAHGELAVPVPATTLLLEGVPVRDDGREGERVTPTGAAILRHLDPSFGPVPGPARLAVTGTGFGTRRFEGMSNVLRALAFEPAVGADRGAGADQSLGVCEFEVDDQTPEDLAVALERLRGRDGVVDVTQVPVFGKKGRVAARVQVLVRPAAIDAAIAACFDETATLGVRWHVVQRRALDRESWEARIDGHPVGVKQARRPDGTLTRKAEIDDLAAGGGNRAARERVRRAAESAHGEGAGDDD